MKMCISIIHLGRYKIDMLDDDNKIVRGYDCGLAGVLVALNNWIFVPEHVAYQADQRKSSDELGREAILKLASDPTINPRGLPVNARYPGRVTSSTTECKHPKCPFPAKCHNGCVDQQPITLVTTHD
jgi:hypothetical protein